ncbi:hypothetical protein LINPERPRIM_LOCUS37615 [Linum perenne]
MKLRAVFVTALAENFFLIEFQSEKLCNSVLGRSWHIHNSGMIMRRWEKGIKPVDFSPKATPEWIEFRRVPPELYTVNGISWISSTIGKPLTKFVRDGATIKVCVLRDRAVTCPEVLKIDFSETERFCIEVVQHKPREYRRGVVRAGAGQKIEWQRKVDTENGAKVDKDEGNGAEPLVKGKDPPATPIQITVIEDGDVAVDTGNSSVQQSEDISRAAKKKSRKKRQKKSKEKEIVEIADEVPQSKRLPNKIVFSGNDVASSPEGTASPAEGDFVKGIGVTEDAVIPQSNIVPNEIIVSEEVESQAEPLLQDGHLNDVEDRDEIPESSGRGKPAKKQAKGVSGVKTWFKNKFR